MTTKTWTFSDKEEGKALIWKICIIIRERHFEIDDSINEINQIPYKYEIEDEYEFISINKSSIYIYDEFIKRDIKNEDKELVEALVSVLIFGNRNFLKWSDVYEKIKN